MPMVGYSIDSRMKAGLVVSALRNAIGWRLARRRRAFESGGVGVTGSVQRFHKYPAMQQVTLLDGSR